MPHKVEPGHKPGHHARQARQPRVSALTPAIARWSGSDVGELLLHLQRTIGNQAVNDLLHRQAVRATPLIQRAPDTADEREEAVKAAQAELAQAQQTLDTADEDDEPVVKGGPRPVELLTLHADDMCGGKKCVTDDDIYGPTNAAEKRFDQEIDRERELSKIPYKERLDRARHAASDQTDQEDWRKLTAEEVWEAGQAEGLFFDHEEAVVKADQNKMRGDYQEKREEEDRRVRHQAESEQYQNWVAQGEQMTSPAPFLQPFAFGALGTLIGAAYGGAQTGAMIGDAVNACAHGSAGDCAAAMSQLAIVAGTHAAIRGKPGEPGEGRPPGAPPVEQGDMRGIRDPEGNITIRGKTTPAGSSAPTTTGIPQGLTEDQFARVSQKIRAGAGQFGDDICVHGSRAAGTARPDSDIDVAIRVDGETFDKLIRTRFKTPNPGSAKERTMLHAIETGKIQAGEAGLSGLRRSVQGDLGLDVDISIIRIDGPTDRGPWIPLK